MDVKLPSLRLPTASRRLLHSLSLIYLVLLVLIVAETLYVVTRDVGADARAQAETQYPSQSIEFSQGSLKVLDSLQSAPAIPPASGKGNPFVP